MAHYKESMKPALEWSEIVLSCVCSGLYERRTLSHAQAFMFLTWFCEAGGTQTTTYFHWRKQRLREAQDVQSSLGEGTCICTEPPGGLSRWVCA